MYRKKMIGVNVRGVQEYISKSRKIKDLSNASRIMSEMMKRIVKKLKEEVNDINIVYPSVNDKQKMIDYSNYLLAVFESEDYDSLIDRLERYTYEEMSKEYLERIKYEINAGGIKKYHRYTSDIKDIKDFFKDNFIINMAIIECENYSESYIKMMKIINSMKNTNNFNSINILKGLEMMPNREEIGIKKCSLCGENYIRYTKDGSKDMNQPYINLVSSNHLLSEDESLCDICFYRRIKENEYFGSTYEIATKWYVAKVKEKANENFKKLLKKLNKKITDEVLTEKYFYNSNLLELLEKNQEKELILQIKKMIKINNKMKKNYDVKPSDQYALIQLDIDNLGEWMRGKYINGNIGLKEYQKELSQVISYFSSKLKHSYKENLLWEVVYAGGDDFLVLLPVENIFETINVIKNEFSKNKSNKYEKLTYSMCVTLANVRIPLAMVLKKTREELKNVKRMYSKVSDFREYSKNGFVLNNMINRGKSIVCYMRNPDFVMYHKLYLLLKKAVKTNENSNTFIKKIEKIIMVFNHNNLTIDDKEILLKIFENEVHRLIRRSISIKKSDLLNDKDLDKIEKINYFFYKKQIVHKHGNDYRIDQTNYLNILKNIDKMLSYKMEFGGN